MSLTPLPRFLLPSRTRIRIVFLAVLAAIALGTVAFHLLEGWSILDSLYVTVQTVTTVGFGDVTPKTALGRAFATMFMMLGVGIVLYALHRTGNRSLGTVCAATFTQNEQTARSFYHLRRGPRRIALDTQFTCGRGDVSRNRKRSD